jgi:DNA-directed RNA polymerase specialized sigma subunit
MERNRLIVAARKEHPEYSLAEIAEIFGVTRQRVWQIIEADRKSNGK